MRPLVWIDVARAAAGLLEPICRRARQHGDEIPRGCPIAIDELLGPS